MVKATLKTYGEHYLKALEAIKHLGKGRIKMGLLANSSKAQKVKTDGKRRVRVVEYAYWQEYGTTRGIPPRPFLRLTTAEQRDKWGRIFMASIKGRLLQKGILRDSLDKVGLTMVADVRDKINSNIAPQLKPATVTAKIRAKKAVNSPDLALVQDGDLLEAISYEVVA